MTYDKKALRWILVSMLLEELERYLRSRHSRYSSIHAGLRRREASGIVAGREMCGGVVVSIEPKRVSDLYRDSLGMNVSKNLFLRAMFLFFICVRLFVYKNMYYFSNIGTIWADCKWSEKI